MMNLLHIMTGMALLYPIVSATPKKVLDSSFADPSFVLDTDAQIWYSFATSNGDNKIKVATASSALCPWESRDIDPLPKAGAWHEDYCIWAPDAIRVGSDEHKWVMYYTAPAKDHKDENQPCGHTMCVGAAWSDNIEGPYTPADEPLACPAEQGGAINPNGYYDILDDTHWVVYKVDGSSIGAGGVCKNSEGDIKATPIMMQEVDRHDGTTLIGEPLQILDRGDADGPLIEAPNMIRIDDDIILFFSSNCWSTDQYDISYAVSTNSVRGPYTKAKKPLLVTGDYDLRSPGGASSDRDHHALLFHASCDSSKSVEEAGRCLYETEFSYENGVITIK